MADGDIVIASSATDAAPHEYLVKGAEYFAVKQVQALFEDNGAAGAWLPALEIVAPPGIVTGRYVGTSVAAGSGQEVTFHPLGSKGASAAPSASGTPLAVGQRKSFSAAANATTHCYPLDNFDTNTPADFSQDGATGALRIDAAGLYRADTWAIMYALPASIPTSVPATLLFELGADAPPNTGIGWFYGASNDVTGTLSVGAVNQWQLFATTFLAIGTVPYVLGTSIVGNSVNTHSWNVDWAIIVVTRLDDVPSFDFAAYGT